MKIEDADLPLRELAEKIATTVQWLTGAAPELLEDGWYKCGKSPFMWFYITGSRGSKYPNSIRVASARDSIALQQIVGVKLGDNNYGKTGRELHVEPGDTISFARCLEFIGDAYEAKN